jgi:hypothetical protein
LKSFSCLFHHSALGWALGQNAELSAAHLLWFMENSFYFRPSVSIQPVSKDWPTYFFSQFG